MGKPTSIHVKKASIKLKNIVYQKLDAFLYGHEDSLHVHFEADDTILTHGISIMKLNDHHMALLPPDIFKKAFSGGVYLSKRLKRQLRLGEMISSELITDAVVQKSVSKLTGGSVLTHSPREIGAMKAIELDPAIQHTNNILSEHWNIIIPYAEQISVAGLLKLREREGESFIKFRKTIDNSVAEAFKLKGGFTEKDARELFADIIEPELAQLELKTKSATKDLVKKPLIVMSGIGAALGVGAFTGMLSGDLAVAAKALGLGKIVYDGVTSTMERMDVEREIKQENFYYLWKMKKAAD